MNFSSDGEHVLHWIEPRCDPDTLKKLADQFNIHPITAQIFINRGMVDFQKIHQFLYAKLPDLFDPYLFPGMEHAVDRICQAVDQGESILIYGDNDVDGMTGCALLTDFLSSLGADVHFYVPDRNKLKKSIIMDALRYAVDHTGKLLITFDCSITGTEELEEFIKDKVDIIITDHHEPTAHIPHCIATLNPKLLNSTYPNRELTGVGVAFKLAHGITNHRIAASQLNPKDLDLKKYLDLVALGTIADMGALVEENRILVRYGLKELKHTSRIGLKQLFSLCDLTPKEINANSVASKIAPRMNSLGRIANPRKGVEFLLVEDPTIAKKMAKELDLNNTERQKIERVVSEEIDRQLAENPDILTRKAIVLSSRNWHPGVIPIITARIAKQYNRPTVLIAVDQGIGKGSMRTIKEFPLLPFLKRNASLFINFGGHDMASGLTIEEEKIDTFKMLFLEQAEKDLHRSDLKLKLHLDGKADFADLTFEFMDSLTLLEPFGNENNHPIFYCHVRQAWPPKVINNFHLKLFLEQGERILEGMALGMAYRRKDLCKKGLALMIAYTPQVNYYQNKASIQLIIKDFRILS